MTNSFCILFQRRFLKKLLIKLAWEVELQGKREVKRRALS